MLNFLFFKFLIMRKLQEQVSHPAGEVAGHVRISIEDWNK